MTAMPTFTAPLCSDVSDATININTDQPTRDANAATEGAAEVTSPTTNSAGEALITPPPYMNSVAFPSGDDDVHRTCTPVLVCVDYLAVCGTSTQMYGG